MGAWVDDWNLIEAVLWFVLGAIFAAKAAQQGSARRRWFVLLAVAFFAFGLSDLIEMRTGAWWRPWWLVAGKTGCVAMLVFGFWKLFHAKAPPP